VCDRAELRRLVGDVGGAITLYEEALAQAHRTGRPLGLLFLDLDGFKYINDSLGHEIGDRLLRTAAVRLQAIVRPGDTVARLGGHAFGVMLVDMKRPEDAAAIAHDIVQALSRPLRADERTLHVTASVGVATFPADGDNAELLLKHADAAMYRAKAHGRNGVQCYTRDMGLQAHQRVELQTALRLAVEQGQFELHYQPQCAPESGRIVAVEALIRWQHPELGLVSPDRFIPLAEETGLIAPIGRWVLRTACRQLQAWHAAGHTRLVMAVNLSARQFLAQDIPQLVREVLEEHGLPARALELELTETALMHNADAVRGTLQALKDLGVVLALDDFGTGYSSLNHLRRFPIDAIKIDRSFTAEMASSDDTTAIVRAIVAMARSLGVQAVAEGVENEAQLRFLAALQCDRVQGYHLGRPQPAAELTPGLGEPDQPPACDLLLESAAS
jgi:diguanylate cyclase (GGDEF)-like protein